ncbi:hypothetical protein BH11MYX4_BH11MYX4_67340 [soil metagenome]
MRLRLWLGPFALLTLVAPAALTACAASSAGSAAPDETPEAGATSPAASPDGGKPDAGDAGGGDAAPKNDCKLPELKGVADVTPTFVTYASPNLVPPTMTGGTLMGSYTVDKATVFFPSGSESLADPKKSTGTVNAWAIFNGTSYRLHLKSQFTIASALGPQSQGADTASQGAFTVSAAALTLDHACDTTIAQEADYSFTVAGGGRATILIKTPSPYGDTYLQLDAAKD